MAAVTPFESFDPTFEQPRRVELQPVDATPRELRDRLLRSLVSPWRAMTASDPVTNSDSWFWVACEGGSGGDRTGYVLLHEIAGRLRVTNVGTDAPGGSLSLGEQNALIERFRHEVVEPLERDGAVVVHENDPIGSLARWVDEKAIEKLARFSLLANRSSGSAHPSDSARWNAFLVEALPVRDGTGFAEVLQTVLIRNGWPEHGAVDLAIQVEQANELLALYRSVNG